ncbi:hypothetical protein GQ457_14G017950 [Hibiscus cannabinus]
MDIDGLPNDGVWKPVWSLRMPQRIRTFLWITLHQRHLTNAERFRQDIATSAMCSICYLDVEDLDHILRWVRVNVDASVNIADGKAAIGCLFLNDQGSWINFFVRDVGRCSVLIVELWAVQDGLAQAWTLGFRRVVIDSDCLEVIKILKQSYHALIGNNLVESILHLTQREWQVVFRHVSRYQNAISDRLAVVGRSSSRCGLLLPFPPDDLSAQVEEEKEQNAGEPVLTQDWHATANVVCFNLHIDPCG